MLDSYHAFSYVVGQVKSQQEQFPSGHYIIRDLPAGVTRSSFPVPIWFSFHQLGSFISFILTVLIYPFNTYLQEVVTARGSVWDACCVIMGPKLFERFDTQDN